MTVSSLREHLSLKVLSEGTDQEIASCYISDLLSRVMGGCGAGDVWITVQSSMNAVAVAVLADASCVILAEGVMAPDDVIARAKEEELSLFTSGDSAYDLARKIASLI